MRRSVWSYLALSLTLALGLAAPAAAQDFSSFYVTPKIMTSNQRVDMSGGTDRSSSVFGVGFSLGTDLSYTTSMPLRAEVEYLYHGNESFKRPGSAHDISAHSFLVNAFFDIQTDSVFTPYVGGGVGLGYLRDRVIVSNGDGGSAKGDCWNFAWNVGGGLAWGLSETMALDFGYRHMDLGKTMDLNIGGSHYNASLTANEFSLGLRIMSY